MDYLFFLSRNSVVLRFVLSFNFFFGGGGVYLYTYTVLFFNITLRCSHWHIDSYLECIHNTPSYSRTWWSKGPYICYSLFRGPDRRSEDDLSTFVSTRSLWLRCRRYSRPVPCDNMLGRCSLGTCSPSCNRGISLRRKLVEFRSSRCPSNWFAGSRHCRRLLCYTGRDTLQ